MSEPLEATTLSQLTLFAEDFPVNHTPWLADERALRTNATSGPSSPDSFASSDPDGCWLKTCQGYSQMTLDGSLEAFSETWPRAGMTRSGIAYQLRPLAPLTDVTACGLWPTPQTAYDGSTDEAWQRAKSEKAARHRAGEYAKGTGAPGMMDLQRAVRMLPTPTVGDSKNARNSTARRFKIPPTGIHAGDMLTDYVTMWPTPAATDWKGIYKPETVNARALASSRGVRLPEEVSKREQNSGQLNPTWVEWLMGYPLGWTDCGASGTRSSRKSRNGLAEG